MSAGLTDDPRPQLLMEAKLIAWRVLAWGDEIDDFREANHFLNGSIAGMIAQGQRSRLMLSNRAIAAFRQYRQARTIELTRVSRGTAAPGRWVDE